LEWPELIIPKPLVLSLAIIYDGLTEGV